jgi:hypothetical protein
MKNIYKIKLDIESISILIPFEIHFIFKNFIQKMKILLLFLLLDKIFSNEGSSLLSPTFINSTTNMKIEENQPFKFDCLNKETGCFILFNKLNISGFQFLEVSVKLRMTNLFDDISNGLGFW